MFTADYDPYLTSEQLGPTDHVLWFRGCLRAVRRTLLYLRIGFLLRLVGPGAEN